MRARKGSRVRHAEQVERFGEIARIGQQWDAEGRRWEPAAEVNWDSGWPSWWPLRDLVLVRRERAALARGTTGQGE